MKVSIITLFPAMISGFFSESIVKRAQEKGLVEIEVINLRDFSKDSYKTVDDKPYGGGVGMVMKVEPIAEAISSVKTANSRVVYPSAKGATFNQKKAKEYSKLKHLIILAGHYEGVDERVLSYVDEEVSLGDFVVTGGEIATVAITDAIVRLIPNVLVNEEATVIESFFEVPLAELMKAVGESAELEKLKTTGISTVTLLEYPQYTRPELYDGKKVPDVLLSGNHKEIERWRLQMAFAETIKKRPDLLRIKEV
jgi:tRNA (guanine37-N1)-methyltransferase